MENYKKQVGFFVFVLVFQCFHASVSWAVDRPSLTPKPQVINWLPGAGPLGKVTVEYDSAARSPQAQELFLSLGKDLPRNQIPYEGYLLKVQADGVLLLVRD